ncbi:helix-turn-helix domain-containing protein [Ruminococcus sp.]|nr:helix-turn-helix domain-containing protein [Ruminococcus sp.]
MTDEEIKQTIAQNIAQYRKKLGLTQFELSEKINYSDKSISKWERGVSHS